MRNLFLAFLACCTTLLVVAFCGLTLHGDSTPLSNLPPVEFQSLVTGYNGFRIPPFDADNAMTSETSSPIRLEPARVRNPVLFRSVDVTLESGTLAEIEIDMTEGEQTSFRWSTRENGLSFLVHGGRGGKAKIYEAGRDIRGDDGTVISPLTGHIGWEFRNEAPTKTILSFQTQGNFRGLRWHAHSQ